MNGNPATPRASSRNRRRGLRYATTLAVVGLALSVPVSASSANRVLHGHACLSNGNGNGYGNGQYYEYGNGQGNSGNDNGNGNGGNKSISIGSGNGNGDGNCDGAGGCGVCTTQPKAPHVSAAIRHNRRKVIILVKLTRGATGVLAVDVFKGESHATMDDRGQRHTTTVPNAGRWTVSVSFTGDHGWANQRITRTVMVN
jgi:hypothetical protein